MVPASSAHISVALSSRELRPAHPIPLKTVFPRTIRRDLKTARLAVTDVLDWVLYPFRQDAAPLSPAEVAKLIEFVVKQHPEIRQHKQARSPGALGLWSESINGESHHTRTADIETMVTIIFALRSDSVLDPAFNLLYKFQAAQILANEVCRPSAAETVWRRLHSTSPPLRANQVPAALSLTQLMHKYGEFFTAKEMMEYQTASQKYDHLAFRWAVANGLSTEDSRVPGEHVYLKPAFLPVLGFIRERVAMARQEADEKTKDEGSVMDTRPDMQPQLLRIKKESNTGSPRTAAERVYMHLQSITGLPSKEERPEPALAAPLGMALPTSNV